MKEESAELKEKQNKATNGGGCTSEPDKCPKCNSTRVDWTWFTFFGYKCKCTNCGYEWEKK